MIHHRLTRAALLACLAASPLVLAHEASASTVTESKTFTNDHGRKIVETTTLNRTTDALTVKITTTLPNGKQQTITTKSMPDTNGGFKVTRSVTGFSGKTHTSSGDVTGSKTRESRTFKNNKGRKVTESSMLDQSTGALTQKVTITRPSGKMETVTDTSTPTTNGGFKVSRSQTGFNGQTHASTSHVGGHGGKTGNAGGHGRG